MVDQLLGGLFGGQDDDDDDVRRRRATDFVDRYEHGAPYDGINDDEVIQNYRATAGRPLAPGVRGGRGRILRSPVARGAARAASPDAPAAWRPDRCR